MDTNTTQKWHNDMLGWDRLHLSSTCRQIFSETASTYFTLKLLPYASRFPVLYRRLRVPRARSRRPFTPSQARCFNHDSIAAC
jgi:hypothetical protein